MPSISMHELEHVAAGAAAETLVELVHRMHRERGRLFVVERAEARVAGRARLCAAARIRPRRLTISTEDLSCSTKSMRPAGYYPARRPTESGHTSAGSAAPLTDDILIGPTACAIHCRLMPAAKFFAELTPYARIGTAVAPFVVALLLRLFFGKNRLTSCLISLATMWFTVNVLIAPYSLRMQQELRQIFH